MKKINKLLLSLSSVSALALPLLAAQCGKGGKFDQTDDGKLKIATGFSENNKQGAALKAVVASYNAWLKSGSIEEQKQKKEQGYLPLEYDFLPSGYSTGPLTTKLGAKDKSNFWNILINYPTAASILATKNMNLSLSNEDYESLGILNTFKNVNDEIGGNTEKKEKWVIPFSRSSEMSSIDKVLLGKLLKEIKSIEGVEIEKEVNKIKKINEYIAYYESVASTDGKYVDTEWGKAKVTKEDELDTVKKAIKDMKIKLSDDMFYEYDNLIKFSIAAKKLYSKDNSKYILGFDSLASAVNVMNVAVTKGDKSKQYINPSKEHEKTGGYDYESFLTSGTSQNRLFKSLLSNVFEGISAGAIWVGGGGSYGSSYLTRHNLAISIGSTAGYTHTFVKGDDKTIYYLNNQKIEFNAPNELTKAKNAKDVLFTFKSGKYENKIYKFKLSEGTTVGTYDKQFANQEVENKFINGFKEGYKLLEAELKTESGKTSLINAEKKSETLTNDQISKVIDLGEAFAGSPKKYVLIDGTLIKTSKLSKDSLLNKNDADWLSAPLTKTSEDKKSVFIQGPSLVLIHANEKENLATKLFVKWLFNNKHSEIKIQDTTYNNINSIDAFNQHGNYISATSSYFEDSNAETIEKLSPAEKLAFENFKLVAQNPNEYQSAEDVSSSLSDTLRDSIRAAGVKMTGQVSNDKNPSFEDFLKEIENLFK